MQSSRVHRPGCIVASILGALLSGLMLYLIVVRPASRVMAARSWTATPCTIVSAVVVRESRSAGDTRHRPIITYRYSFDGTEHTSNRYDLMGDAGWRTQRTPSKIVERYRAGMITTCYVNPAAPSEAVLQRGLPVRMWWAVLPLVLFLLCGLGLLVGIFAME